MTLEGFGLGLRPQHFPDILGDDPTATEASTGSRSFLKILSVPVGRRVGT